VADTAAGPRRLSFDRLGRWLGGAALAASIAFIGDRLWRLDWSSLQPHATWQLGAAMVGAPLLFAAADRALAQGWAATADPEGQVPRAELAGIYARGVLMKYLPGSVFQYVSRQVGGARAGLAHKRLAQASIVEVGLHLVSSLSVAGACLVLDRMPVAVGIGAAALAGLYLTTRNRWLTAFAFQILAFTLFAGAAALVGWAILPEGLSLAHFAALFLLAWLAGFVVPVAPGGIGVREAALLALAGPAVAAAPLMAATLALRASSIAGDLLYGLLTLAAGRRSRA
jgi:hypothetical protein